MTFNAALSTTAFTLLRTAGFSGSASFVTVIVTLEVFVTALSPLPCVAVTVTSAVPSPTALISPLSFTVTTFSSEELHVSVTSFASFGSYVAVAFAVSPTFKAFLSTVAVTLVRTGFSGSAFFDTVISTSAVFVTVPCFAVTITLAFPSAFAVTFPSLSTVKTSVLEDFHSYVTSLASAGYIVAVAFALSPTFSSVLSTDTVTSLRTPGFSGRMISPPFLVP